MWSEQTIAKSYGYEAGSVAYNHTTSFCASLVPRLKCVGGDKSLGTRLVLCRPIGRLHADSTLLPRGARRPEALDNASEWRRVMLG